MEREIDISIVIPVYNTTKILEELTKDVATLLKINQLTFEILLVDDCSPNVSTWQHILNTVNANEHVSGIKLTRNFGQQSATLCGLSMAKGRHIVTMDDDYQHHPEDILKLYEQREHDIVIGHLTNKVHSFSRRLASQMKGYFDEIILGKPKDIQLSAFRMFRKHVVQGMLQIKTPTPFIAALMFYVSKDIVGVKIPHHERMEGASGYGLKQMIRLFSFLLINNSSLLLRTIGNIGLFMSATCLLLIFLLVSRYFFFEGSITGWTSTMITLIFFGGAQLFSIGIIGEYLIRIIGSVEEKPPFIVRDIITKDPS